MIALLDTADWCKRAMGDPSDLSPCIFTVYGPQELVVRAAQYNINRTRR